MQNAGSAETKWHGLSWELACASGQAWVLVRASSTPLDFSQPLFLWVMALYVVFFFFYLYLLAWGLLAFFYMSGGWNYFGLTQLLYS